AKAAATRANVTASASGNAPLAVCARTAASTASGPGSRRGSAKCAASCQAASIANSEPSRAAISATRIVVGGGIKIPGAAGERGAADRGDRLEQRARVGRFLRDRARRRAVEIAAAIDCEGRVGNRAEAGADRRPRLRIVGERRVGFGEHPEEAPQRGG